MKGFSQPGTFGRAAKPAEFKDKKIAIAGFQIEFAIEQTATAGARGSSAVEKIYTPKEVDEARVQKLTDAAYDAFVELLTQRGYDVQAKEALTASAILAPQMANASKPPVRCKRSAATKLLISGSSDLDRDNISITASAPGTAPDLWTGLFSLPVAMKYVDEATIPTITVRLKFNFARFDDSGSWGYSELDDKPQNVLGSKGTKIDAYWPGSGWAALPLLKSVVSPNLVAEKATEVGMTGGQKAATTATVALGLLGGFLKGGISGAAGSAASSTRSVGGSGNFEVKADANYDADTLKNIKLALELVAEALPK